LKELCDAKGAELNVEGYPTDEFLAAVMAARPAQCTLVPDQPGQLTSDHGWQIATHESMLRKVVGRLAESAIRFSIFMDFDSHEMELVREIGAERVELYTEPYAAAHGSQRAGAVLDGFRGAANRAQEADLGVNAGHDLNLGNLGDFIKIPGILEVSIGHALLVECLEEGLPAVLGRYLQILGADC